MALPMMRLTRALDLASLSASSGPATAAQAQNEMQSASALLKLCPKKPGRVLYSATGGRNNSSRTSRSSQNVTTTQQQPGQNISPDPIILDHHHMHQGHQNHQQEPTVLPTSIEVAQVVNPVQQPTTSPQNHTLHGNHHQLDTLALLAQALGPYAAQASSLNTPGSKPPGGRTESLYNPPTGGSGSTNAAGRSTNEDEQVGSYGTLMLSKRGRSKYLGPTAGSEWLNESETQDVSETPLATRAPSPALPQDSTSLQTSHNNPHATTPIGFPLSASAAHISTRDLISCLPPREEAWALCESYYRYCAWHHDVAPRSQFERTFDRVYKISGSGTSSPINPQEIALVFIVMAQGTMFNIEMPNFDSSAEDWLHLAERALVKGDFLSNNTLAGVQTLHLMAHLHLHLDKGRHGDNAWPIWGLVMRLVQAMGMHRDGDRWNLPHDVAEERRKVFWECNAADVFQAHCFSRPSAINPEHCDTAFPSGQSHPNGEKSYSILRFELSQLSAEILNMAMKVRKPAYSEVTELGLRLLEFERNIPFSLRCRAALLAMPSQYPVAEAAINASPEPSRRSVTISFQQSNFALNVSETIINLHRPYYAKALYEVDRVESIYKTSFYTVIERCAIIIGLVTDIHTRFPAVSTRQWNFWYHVFNSALCLGTLVLRDPGNIMSSFVLTQLNASISLFTSLLQHGARTPRYKRNLQWLIKLRARALTEISTASTTQRDGAQRDAEQGHRNDVEEERDDEDKIIKMISLATAPVGSQFPDSGSLQQKESMPDGQIGTLDLGLSNASLPMATLDSMNDVLHEFWDPMLLQDVFEGSQDQSNPFLMSRATWWDESAPATDAV
uniref:Xylanolytic transcriptional activator regulatory domain-containing protein n=1 Tax=Bionectria ochroleuca TaxID=29856 RepID=A0A8H7NQV2_BIOOC